MHGKTFVYALKDKGVVFYVGQTDDIYVRFSAHFYDAPCKFYISNMLINKEMPGLLIIAIYDNTDNKHVFEIEKTFIKYFASVNQKLCNNEHNNFDNIINTDILNKKLPELKRGLKNTIVKDALNKYLNK